MIWLEYYNKNTAQQLQIKIVGMDNANESDIRVHDDSLT